MNIQWRKRSGGDINIGVLLWLNMCIFIISFLGYNINSYNQIIKNLKASSKYHLVKLELYYYARNEIYDESYQNLSYNDNDIKINITFKYFEKEVIINFENPTFSLNERYKFDKDCKCLSEKVLS